MTARAVTFTYPGTKRAAVSGVDLNIAPGTTVALVGANGAGKTTLAKLLLGLYVPSAGQLIRRGVDTREATRRSVQAGTAAVFQNYQRYQMSLRDNVILAETTAAGDEERLLRALREGGVPEELWQGPDGLDVMLSREFGTRDLSLGQWQRLAIARVLFREHDTILLDEPTASIDPLEEQAVYERFMRIAAGRTAIIVTHRLASARLADRIPGARTAAASWKTAPTSDYLPAAACTTACSRPRPPGTGGATIRTCEERLPVAAEARPRRS